MTRSHATWLPKLPFLAALSCAAALTTSLPVRASPIEHEVDVAGAPGFVVMQYGDHTLNAALVSSLEVDGYTFSGHIGDQFRIQFQTRTGGLDPSLVLRGPTGTVLTSTSCNGNDGFGRGILCSTSLTRTLSADGIYTLNVSDINADEAGNYQFHIEHYPPINNWGGVAYGTSNEVTNTLGHTTDIDNFAFRGVAGTGVQLTLRTTTGGLDPVIEIWGPNGSAIPGNSCNGNDGFGRGILCTASVELNIMESGIYKIGLTDSGLDETGGYKLSVACQFGACPSVFEPAPQPVPEPQTYAMLMAGLGLLLLARRRIAL